MSYTLREGCIAARVSQKKVESLANRLEKLGKEAEKMGLHIFGSSGSGTVRTRDCGIGRSIIVARICAGYWDGGDGGEREIEGVWYGE